MIEQKCEKPVDNSNEIMESDSEQSPYVSKLKWAPTQQQDMPQPAINIPHEDVFLDLGQAHVCQIIHANETIFTDLDVELSWKQSGKIALVKISKPDSHCLG